MPELKLVVWDEDDSEAVEYSYELTADELISFAEQLLRLAQSEPASIEIDMSSGDGISLEEVEG